MEWNNYRSPLEAAIEQYISDGLESRGWTIKRASIAHFQLVGSSTPFIHIGYVRFLKAMGFTEPTMDDLNSLLIGRYWEFVTQHHGTLASEKGMRALRGFWIWANTIGYIKPRRMPADLSALKTKYPFQIKLTLLETK